MNTSEATHLRPLALVTGLLVLFALVLLVPQSGSAAPLVARDGKIHACFKAKGKGRGTLRVVVNAKVRCPRGWRKAAWAATAAAGPSGPRGERGEKGQPGQAGPQGATGEAGSVVVEKLEGKVTELLTKVQTLEGVLSGVTNLELKEAIENVAKVEALEGILDGVTNQQLLDAIGVTPVVGALCEQTEELNGQTTALGGSLSSLNTLLNTLLIGFSPVTVPTNLPTFVCPTS